MIAKSKGVPRQGLRRRRPELDDEWMGCSNPSNLIRVVPA